MIKLKSFLKESYAWERKAGEPLPTMKTVQEKYQRNLKEQEATGDFGDGDFSTKVLYRAIWNELNSAVPGGKNQKTMYGDTESMGTTWTGPDAEWIAELDPYQDKKYAVLTVSIKQTNTAAQATFDHIMQRFMRNGKPADPSQGYIAYRWVISPMTMDGSNASVEGAIRILRYVQDTVKPGGVTEAYDAKGVEEAKDKPVKKDKKSKGKKGKRWQDNDGDGNWYEKEDVSEGAMCESCGSQDCQCESADESVLNMRESFWGRVKGNFKGHEYILREAFRK